MSENNNMSSVEYFYLLSKIDVSVNIVSNIVTVVFQWICYALVGQAIDVFGIGANVINIIIFTKQGFKDPVNISLLGLAVSDIGCLATLIWTNICYTPAFREADIQFHPIEINYLTSGIPHTVFTRITAWITALITLERCLCITAPLKVKTTITSRRVTIIVTSLFVVLISSAIPVYVVHRLDWKFFHEKNRTLIGLVFTKDRDVVEKVCYVINNVLIPFTSFLINIVCTIILVYSLQKTAQWRNQSTSVHADNISHRNQKVAKMVVMISSLFIICFIPLSIIFIAMSLEPELFINGKYQNILITIGGFAMVLESVNSSVNIVIYYNMSSKYKMDFRRMFSSCSRHIYTHIYVSKSSP